jgi:hypothetical protein
MKMKSKLIHQISDETGKKVQDHLTKQTQHGFLKINELGITVNTSEIEGIYTQDQYDDLTKISEGQWKCAYNKWHKKRNECSCKDEAMRQANAAKRQKLFEKEYAELTDEQRAINLEKMRTINEEAAIKGSPFFRAMFQGERGKAIRKSTIKRLGVDIKKLKGLNIENDTK